MSDSLIILGRLPALGIAELESVCGGEPVEPVSNQAALLHVEPEAVDFKRLGGSVKLCKLLTTLDTTNWKEVEKYLIQSAPEHAQALPEGKMHLGLSAYGMNVGSKQLLATGLSIKKAIQRATTKSVRLVPNKSAELNAAQVLHHRLTGETGWELVLVRSGNRTVLGQTTAVQDIDAYAARDFDRPKRDAKVGMLPPKLAQIIVNLAVAGASPEPNTVVIDPFCGTGVVLQEALLMGYGVYGTDIEQRMIDYTSQNLAWLSERHHLPVQDFDLEAGDATTHSWSRAAIRFVASETYLGRPFTAMPSGEVLAQTASECNVILKKFLQNITPQLQPGTRLCLAIPAWQIRPKEFKHLPLVDQIEELGYNQVRFKHVRDADLLYYRPDQIVARELLVITRK